MLEQRPLEIRRGHVSGAGGLFIGLTQVPSTLSGADAPAEVANVTRWVPTVCGKGGGRSREHLPQIQRDGFGGPCAVCAVPKWRGTPCPLSCLPPRSGHVTFQVGHGSVAAYAFSPGGWRDCQAADNPSHSLQSNSAPENESLKMESEKFMFSVHFAKYLNN